MTDTQNWSRYLVWFAALALLCLLMMMLSPILTPFVMAALLAYLGDPLVDRLETWKLSRTGAVVVVFTAIFAAMLALPLLLIPTIEDQLSNLLSRGPEYWSRFTAVVAPLLERYFGVALEEWLSFDQIWSVVQGYWKEAGGLAASIATYVSRSGMAVVAVLMNLLLIPVVTFYLLRDWDLLVARLRVLLPRDVEPTIVLLARQSDEVLGGFLRGQLLVMISLTIMYSAGLWLVGVEFAFLIGMLAGLVSFIPYLGAIVGVGAGVIAAGVQFQELLPVLAVLLVFGVGQTIESMLLTPWLVGDRIGLHPVAVLFAILAGGQLFGFLGVLMALPVAAVLMVLLRFAQQNYLQSQYYRSKESLDGAAAAREQEPSLAAQAASSQEFARVYMDEPTERLPPREPPTA